MQYTDEKLCDHLRQLADTLGETPTQKQCNAAETTPSVSTYHYRFDSWNAALEAAGLSINTQNPSYTDDELIARLREFADTCGETPTQKQLDKKPELPSAKAYRVRFGSWNTALEQAGLEVNREFSFTDDELITSLQELAAKLGHTPSIQDINTDTDTPSVQPYIDRFDSWNAALRVADLDINQEDSLTDDELLTGLHELSTELGRTPTSEEIDTRDEFPSVNAYTHHFGSWNAALRAAGLSTHTEPEQFDGTDEGLLDMLRELGSELDTSPTIDDVDFAPDLPNAAVFIDRFGGWNAAKQAAGLEITEHPNQYSDAELLCELRRVARQLDRAPTAADMKQADAPSSSTYARRFDSWTAALEEAGLETPQQTPTQ